MHEAGHYVVGELYGFPMRELKLSIDGRGSVAGVASVGGDRKIDSLADMRRWIEDRLMVVYAGCWAQTLTEDNQLDKSSARSCLKRAKEDYAKVRILMHLQISIDGQKKGIAGGEVRQDVSGGRRSGAEKIKDDPSSGDRARQAYRVPEATSIRADRN